MLRPSAINARTAARAPLPHRRPRTWLTSPSRRPPASQRWRYEPRQGLRRNAVAGAASRSVSGAKAPLRSATSRLSSLEGLVLGRPGSVCRLLPSGRPVPTNATQPVPDINVPKQRKLQPSRQAADFAGAPAQEQGGVLEQGHQRPWREIGIDSLKHQIEECAGTVRTSGVPAELSMARPKPLSLAATRRASVRSGVTSAAVLPLRLDRGAQDQSDGFCLVLCRRCRDDRNDDNADWISGALAKKILPALGRVRRPQRLADETESGRLDRVRFGSRYESHLIAGDPKFRNSAAIPACGCSA